MHILLADDDESVAMVARLGLRRAGFTVTVVEEAGGTEGRARDGLRRARPRLEHARSGRHRRLPAADADPAWPRVPIVFLTAATHDGAEQEALAAGARGVIFKPFDPMTVGEQVRAIIGT